MVSFSCEGCGDVLTKKKLDPHRNQCRGATFTCLDCMVHFWGTEYRAHTSCISEAQKYQGALYRPDKEKKGPKNANNGPKKAYIEDAPDTQLAVVDAPPEAPTPPSAAPDFQAQTPVNVFDFYVGSATPNPSTLDLAAPPAPSAADSSAVVRFSQLDDGSSEALVQYGTGPVPSGSPAPKTPAAKERKPKTKKDAPSSAAKSDKKRKRLHVDTSASPSVDRDLEMTDAPPVLHSGLTGGLQKLMAGAFPPSPDYSGDNVDSGAAAEAAAAAAEPASPVKRAKRAKEGKKAEGGFSTALMQMMTATKRPAKKSSSGAAKEKKKKTEKSARPKKQRAAGGPKLLEYKTPAAAAAAAAAGQLVVYAAGEGAGPEELAGMLLGLVSKGPESVRGVSMNKALKRYHRLRAAGGAGEARGADEKELWKSLRMRRNERGEIVLFF